MDAKQLRQFFDINENTTSEQIEKVLKHLLKTGRNKEFKILFLDVMPYFDLSNDFVVETITAHIPICEVYFSLKQKTFLPLERLNIHLTLDEVIRIAKEQKCDELLEKAVIFKVTYTDVTNDVISGKFKLNILPQGYIDSAILSSRSPEKLFNTLTDKKKMRTSLSLAKTNNSLFKFTIPYLQQYLKKTIEDNEYELFNDFVEEILLKVGPSDVAQFRELLKAGIENFNSAERYPFNDPLIRACLDKKFNKFKGYQFIGKLDEWGQRMIKHKGFWGIINDKGRIIIQPEYDSMGIPKNGKRIALKRQDHWSNPEVVYFDKRGKLITQ